MTGTTDVRGLAAAVLAAPDDQQKAAPLGLFVLLLLGVACYFLFRSMSRHLKRVRDEFPAGPAVARPPVSRAPGGKLSVGEPLVGKPPQAGSPALGYQATGSSAATGTGLGPAPAPAPTDNPDAPTVID